MITIVCTPAYFLLSSFLSPPLPPSFSPSLPPSFSPSLPPSSEVVLGSSTVPHSRYVRQLLSSVRSMWEMRMPPEFVSLLVSVCQYANDVSAL